MKGARGNFRGDGPGRDLGCGDAHAGAHICPTITDGLTIWGFTFRRRQAGNSNISPGAAFAHDQSKSVPSVLPRAPRNRRGSTPAAGGGSTPARERLPSSFSPLAGGILLTPTCWFLSPELSVWAAPPPQDWVLLTPAVSVSPHPQLHHLCTVTPRAPTGSSSQ